jgi:GxxExxY protein
MLEDPDGLNPLTEQIIGCGIEVHCVLGPGLLESVYTPSLLLGLRANGLMMETGRRLPVTYRGVQVHSGFVVDMIVEDRVIVELKAVAALAPVHRAQVICYLKLTGCSVGLLMNFNVEKLISGVQRVLHPALKEKLNLRSARLHNDHRTSSSPDD